jgi:hypothetical protein
MAENTIKGHWASSSVMEGTILELRSAGYIPTEVSTRVPDPHQRVPAPNPGERVVFVPHLIRGLGFPLHPFVCGIMFYYMLDFHHLALNSILHLTSFITVCEAFLHIEPHFGLWQKTFSVKPKSGGAQLAECGGAMISKLQKVTWPEGVFMETIKVW